ncbi:MAG TPA: sigma-54 dependent transcriptional regulator [Bacteroidota bacterium]|nr:sigma-54 dependent transcriptional regulator [Bacteroidota bacterium]
MSGSLGKILVVDDDVDVLLAAKLFLKQHAEDVRTEKNPDVIPSLLRKENFDIILLDMNFTRDISSGQEGFYWLDRILENDPLVVVVLITAYGDVEMAVHAIKAGATDFVLKPWQNEKLLATLSAAMTIRRSRTEVDQLRSRQQQLGEDLDNRFHGFIGQSPAMHQVLGTINKVAKTDANVLILGENGTGKELVARELHRQSNRSQEAFITVDMGALPAGLFESELFGHVKGAFTDARTDRAGRFETASGGTLFLDEIANLPVALQSKLLAVLQNREVTRIGSNKAKSIDIRVISATNRPLNELVEEKQFRQDLLYRINTVEIHLPPLRERTEDISLLVQHFISQYAGKYQKSRLRVPRSTLTRLERYDWPGNVRELEHAVERAIILSEDDILHPEDFFAATQKKSDEATSKSGVKLHEVERAVIREALNKNGGNITQTARELGLTRTALYRRLEKYDL